MAKHNALTRQARTQARWADEVAKVQARNDKVRALTEEGTPDARKQLKAMRDVWYYTDPKPTAKGLWEPGAKPARGSAAKSNRINSGLRAKHSTPKGI